MKLNYTELAAKHQLPAVSQWVQLEEPLSLQDVRKAFQDKLFGYADYLYTLLHPEDLNSMLESQVFPDSEREAMESLYRTLVLLGKDCQLADIESGDDGEAQLLRSILAAWPAIAQQMKAIVAKTKEAYSDNPQHAHHLSYLG